MKFPSPRLIILGALLALPMLFGLARAEEVVTGSETTESINRILRQIEEMAGVLALNDSLNAEQTKALLADLTELHDQVKGLQHANELLLQLAAQAVRDNVNKQTSPAEAPPQAPVQQDPPAQAQQLPVEEIPPAPPQQEPPAQPQQAPVEVAAPAQPVQDPPAADVPVDPEAGTTAPEKIYDKWEPYVDFDLKVDPAGSQYNGWVKASSIDLRWGETGEIILEISNGYSALWTIRNSYTGSPNVSVSTATNGEITVSVRDDEGLHEYSIRSGGLGPIFRRWLQETAVSGNPA